MTPDELIHHYPVLHHMAEYNSWPRIQQIGLRTTEQIVDACQPDPATREAILGQRRTRSFDLEHAVVGTVTIRDQKPLFLHNLAPKLTDVTVEQFLDLLNSRVFMWTHPDRLDRLDRLLGANAYRRQRHDVLVLETASIVQTYYDRIRLTGMNTGATIFPSSPPRGVESFMRISDFPFAERRKRLVDNVVELCVIGGVDHIEDHVLQVQRRQGADVIETIYER
ncbi:DUF7002 family protein [Nocardioides sp. URHA0032]|uniref:DUF7002 family protein n=1 Tax=Nocardioides sp. URHA0032 TaxID=1380388 RepID=UPI000688147A|nr:hypothetical protein [Nocardioides sp. URHA0032]